MPTSAAAAAVLFDIDSLLRSSRYLPASLPSSLLPRHRDNLVRLGLQEDGGYVLTRDMLAASDFLMSCGLAYEWSFEQAFLDFQQGRHARCTIHGYDPTVNQKVLAQKRKRSSRLRHFSAKHRLLSSLHYEQLFDGRQAKHYAEYVRPAAGQDGTDIAAMVARAQDSGADAMLLKMDIEGGEYGCLPQAAGHADSLVGILCEFHETDKRREQFFEFVALMQQSFWLVHIAANNYAPLGADGLPAALELTFENRRLNPTGDRPSTHSYPISGLDYRNCKRSADYRLHFASRAK